MGKVGSVVSQLGEFQLICISCQKTISVPISDVGFDNEGHDDGPDTFAHAECPECGGEALSPLNMGVSQ